MYDGVVYAGVEYDGVVYAGVEYDGVVYAVVEYDGVVYGDVRSIYSLYSTNITQCLHSLIVQDNKKLILIRGM